MSPNIPSLESMTRKRSLDDFLEGHGEEPLGLENAAKMKKQLPAITIEDCDNCTNGAQFRPSLLANTPPANSSPSSLTEAGSSTPACESPSPNITPSRAHLPLSSSAIDGTASISSLTNAIDGVPSDNMPDAGTQTAGVKRKRMTAEEKAARDKAEAERKEERERTRALRAEEKAREEAAKQARAEQRAEQRAVKAAEKAEKAAKVEEKKVAKLEKQQETAKKERSQMRLISFFKVGGTTPTKPGVTSPEKTGRNSCPPAASTDAPDVEDSVYDKMFKPFFLKENVTLARRHFGLDEAARNTKSDALAKCVDVEQQSSPRPFDPAEVFHLPQGSIRRGRVPPSVRDIMTEYNGSSAGQAIDLTTESQNTQILKTQNALRAVRMKYISFHEDVRPSYVGTVTANMPSSSALRALARKPTTRDILPLNYDYDSEAEWQDDDGEDVDLEDDEEDVDGDEDMEDFLDDSEDVGMARLAFTNNMAPESIGPCWENSKRLGQNAHLYKFRMEFILETLEHRSGIDPFSTAYWEPKSKPQPTAAPGPPPAAGPTSAPADAFQALAVSDGSKATTGPGKKPVLALAADLVQKLRELVTANPTLSRVGTIDLFYSQNSSCKRPQIKNALEALAEKNGKIWKLKDQPVA